ncbi:MAG: sugar-binding transcriptional regulator [Anaeromyxobacter sp.]
MAGPKTPRRRKPGPEEPSEQVRLIVKVAQMYHERRLNQSAIADQLGLSQARVSRLLKLAEGQGIVRTTVHVPPGMHTGVESALEERYGAAQVVVVDTGGARDDDVVEALAPSAAAWLEGAVGGCETIGISSWSETLLATVEAMHPVRQGSTRYVVQVLGGVGRPGATSATRLTQRLAEVCQARPVFLLGPGLVGSPGARQTLLRDPHFAEVVSYWDHLSMILTGIGGLETPSRLLRDSAGVMTSEEQRDLAARGAVGEICFRFFDEDGGLVQSPLDARVIGVSFEQLRETPRTVAVAGGGRKFAAIRAALRGRWVDTLITDLSTAERLLRDP